MRKLILLVIAALCIGACMPHSTDSTEVGVRVVKFGILEKKGVVKDIYSPGSTSFFLPIVNDWYVFDAALQNVEMVREHDKGSREGDDSLRFKTVDGNDVSVNVTVAWHIDPQAAPYLVQFIGQDTTEVGERLVRPVSRTIIRDILNELASEQYYDAQIRYEKATEALDRLNYYFGGEGIVVEQVLLGEHKFHDAYEKIIMDKKVAEQTTESLKSETQAAGEQVLRDLEVQKGIVNQAIEQARGQANQKKLQADSIFYQRQRDAEAILAEAQASSEGLKAQARALAGAGGAAQVKLALAEAMTGKPIVFIPASSGMDVRTTDMNALLQRYGIGAIAGGSAAPPAKGAQ